MRAPPPVAVELRTEPHWRAVSAVLWAIAVASLSFWMLQQGGVDPVGYPLTGVLALALAAFAADWRRGVCDRRVLSWTGAQWLLRSSVAPDLGVSSPPDPVTEVSTRAPGQALAPTALATGPAQACSPQVMIDLGAWMLLRLGQLPGPGVADWVAVSQQQVGSCWHGLRVALHGKRSGSTDHPETRNGAVR